MPSKPIYGIIFSNRAGVKKYLELFARQKEGDETIVVPRPAFRTSLSQYFALFKFSAETRNLSYFRGMSKFREISEAEYLERLGTIQYRWQE